MLGRKTQLLSRPVVHNLQWSDRQVLFGLPNQFPGMGIQYCDF
jgi:hypothetical protein